MLRLSQNMRVLASGDAELEAFVDWTLAIGNGHQEEVAIPANMIGTVIYKNSKVNSMSEGKAMEAFCKLMFPSMETNLANRSWLEGRAILAATNCEVSMLNDVISKMLPGSLEVFRSADELENTEDLMRFNAEYLNSLNPNGFPPHSLNLKPGMPLMLLRNINPRQGLCNGTKLVYERSLDNKVLKCRISGSDR